MMRLDTSRVSHFMKKFRKLGYTGFLEVHSSVLGMLLIGQPRTVSVLDQA